MRWQTRGMFFQVRGERWLCFLDNELQDEKGIYEDGQVYLPVDWVDDHINQRFYWDDGEKTSGLCSSRRNRLCRHIYKR